MELSLGNARVFFGGNAYTNKIDLQRNQCAWGFRLIARRSQEETGLDAGVRIYDQHASFKMLWSVVSLSSFSKTAQVLGEVQKVKCWGGGCFQNQIKAKKGLIYTCGSQLSSCSKFEYFQNVPPHWGVRLH